MNDIPRRTTPRRIDAAELNWVEVTEEGRRLCLRLRDTDGHGASVSLPVDCLNAVLTAVPRSARDLLAEAPEQVYDVNSWSLVPGGQCLVLTLHLPDGAKIAFAMKSWQIAAMASSIGDGTAPPFTRAN